MAYFEKWIKVFASRAKFHRNIQTCYFSDGAEHFQLFGIQGWDVFKVISVRNENTQYATDCMTLNCALRFFRQVRILPKNPRDQEVKAALDLGAVDEAVDVAGVHSLSVFSTGAFTHYRNDKKTPLLASKTDK